jgi:hypothetical protein
MQDLKNPVRRGAQAFLLAGSRLRRAEEKVMAYGHAERNLALIHQLEAETAQLLGDVTEPNPEQSAWLRDVASQGKPTVTPAASQGRQPPPSRPLTQRRARVVQVDVVDAQS